jgi:biotin transport system substrate-specific component
VFSRMASSLSSAGSAESAGVLVDTLAGARAANRGWLSWLLREALLVGAGVALLALAAHLRILLPFTVVPITGQTFAVLLLGAAYGWRRGGVTVALYLAAGLAGLPVFADVAGLATAGYLVGFLLAAVVVGWLAERGWDRHSVTALAALLAGEVVIYACGLPWLARFVGWQHVIAAGLLPFLPGDALKLVAAALVLPAAWQAVRMVRGRRSER